MGLARSPMLGMWLFAVLVCAAGVHAWVPSAHAETSAVTCPASGSVDGACVCWMESGVTRMACHQGAIEAPDSTVGRADEGGDRHSASSAARPSRRIVRSPVGEEPSAGMTDEEWREQLELRQQSLDRNLLEVQRARFEARARKESPEELERLDKAFTDVQAERNQNVSQLRALGALD